MRSFFLRHFTEPETLNLAGGGFWQVLDEIEPARVLVRCQSRFAVRQQVVGQRIAGVLGQIQHDMGFRLDQPGGVRPAGKG